MDFRKRRESWISQRLGVWGFCHLRKSQPIPIIPDSRLLRKAPLPTLCGNVSFPPFARIPDLRPVRKSQLFAKIPALFAKISASRPMRKSQIPTLCKNPRSPPLAKIPAVPFIQFPSAFFCFLASLAMSDSKQIHATTSKIRFQFASATQFRPRGQVLPMLRFLV